MNKDYRLLPLLPMQIGLVIPDLFHLLKQKRISVVDVVRRTYHIHIALRRPILWRLLHLVST